MPDYIVKTIDGRNLVIEADKFDHMFNESGSLNEYEFYKISEQSSGSVFHPPVKVSKVASIPFKSVLVIAESNALQADFYDAPDTGLLDSQEFVDAVSDIVDVWHEDSEDGEYQTDTPETPRVYFARRKGGTEWGDRQGSWGFDTPHGFVPFQNKERAELFLPQAEFTWFHPTVPLDEVEEVHE
jgi:hypothetical protein